MRLAGMGDFCDLFGAVNVNYLKMSIAYKSK